MIRSLLRTALASALAGLCLAPLLASFAVPDCGADIPLARWQQRDLTFLAGCWHRLSNMKTTEIGSGRVLGVQSWLFCFGPDGSGSQHLVWTDGLACFGPVRSRFKADDLLIRADQCAGSRIFVASDFRCRRMGPSAADCLGLERDPALRRGRDWSLASDGLFRR